MSKSSQTIGFIGFFDILGYQNLIENNDIISVSKLITEVLVKLPSETKDRLFQMSGQNKTQDMLTNYFEGMKTIVVSDSILIVHPDESSSGPAFESNSIIFFMYCSLLARRAFDAGLPLRGAIDHGEYYLHDHTFAGQPIIDAYKLSNLLDFSGTVLTKSVATELLDGTRYGALLPDRLLSTLVFPTSVPFKTGNSELLYLIDWCEPIQDWGSPILDIRDFVITSFQAHNKNVHGSVIRKVNHTELLVHKCVSRNSDP